MAQIVSGANPATCSACWTCECSTPPPVKRTRWRTARLGLVCRCGAQLHTRHQRNPRDGASVLNDGSPIWLSQNGGTATRDAGKCLPSARVSVRNRCGQATCSVENQTHYYCPSVSAIALAAAAIRPLRPRNAMTFYSRCKSGWHRIGSPTVQHGFPIVFSSCFPKVRNRL